MSELLQNESWSHIPIIGEDAQFFGHALQGQFLYWNTGPCYIARLFTVSELYMLGPNDNGSGQPPVHYKTVRPVILVDGGCFLLCGCVPICQKRLHAHLLNAVCIRCSDELSELTGVSPESF